MSFNETSLYKPIFYQNWKSETLYNLAIWKNGLAFKKINFSKRGRPIIKIAELKNGIASQTKFTNQIFNEDYFLKEGDMVFSWSGNPRTSIDVFWYRLPEGWLNQHIFKVKVKNKLNKNYFYFLLKYLKPNFIEIAKNKQTTGLGHVTLKDFKRIIVRIPKIEEQEKIASILSSLDDKIELNNQINKNLAQMAQAIFKHWFVDFEFSNENGEPYKSSGGEMVESELGPIPKGWKIGKIGDYVKVKSGFAFKNKWWEKYGIPVIKIKNIKNKTIDFSSISYISMDKINGNISKFFVGSGDILIAMTGATVGKIALVPKRNGRALVNQRVGKFFLGEKPLEKVGFLYSILSKTEIFNEIVSTAHGSAQPNISPTQIENIKIVLPSEIILDKYNKLVKPVFCKITENINQNKYLSKLRDNLLPKLMSGEIRVPINNKNYNQLK